MPLDNERNQQAVQVLERGADGAWRPVRVEDLVEEYGFEWVAAEGLHVRWVESSALHKYEDDHGHSCCASTPETEHEGSFQCGRREGSPIDFFGTPEDCGHWTCALHSCEVRGVALCLGCAAETR